MAVFDCSRLNISTALKAEQVDEGNTGNQENANLSSIYLGEKSRGTPVKPNMSAAYFENLREKSHPDGSVLLPDAITFWDNEDV